MASVSKSHLAGRTKYSPPVVSHTEQWEVLLIRIGHHIWRWYREARKAHYLRDIQSLNASIETMVEVKRQYREPFRQAAMAERQAKSERMKKRRATP